MNTPESGLETHAKHLEADAVCAQCGTVNPEDTLLCKNCGNNLREQRARRVASEGAVAAGLVPAERRSWFGILLTLCGILLTVWVLLNIRTIEGWLYEAQAPEEFDVRDFWVGEDTAVYDELWDELLAHEISNGEILAAERNPVSYPGYDGRYILRLPDAPPGESVVGQANVRRRGDTVYFVAEVFSSGEEIRGFGDPERGGRLLARNTAGVRSGQRYFPAMGTATRQEDGSYVCNIECRSTKHVVLAQGVPASRGNRRITAPSS